MTNPLLTWDQIAVDGKSGPPNRICLADVEARPVNWLWEPFIPLGMLSMLSGDPGAGKSYIAQAMAAKLSRGQLCDGRIVEPASTLYLSVENPIAESVRPRFDALGGDAAFFHVFDGPVTLADIGALESAISQIGARLVIVDPVQSYLGASVDLHRSNETRPIMDGLAKLAEAHGCAILLLRHLSKMSGGKAIHRGLGSIDLTGAVRSELLAGSLPDDPEARALVHIKSNVGRIGRALGYAIDSQGRFTWTGESGITAADLLAAPAGPGDHKLAEASQWLTELLSAGEREQKEVRELAEGAGITCATLRRAKNALRVRSSKPKGAMRGLWMWSLPEGAQAAHTDELEHLRESMSTFDKTMHLTSGDPAQNAEGAHTREMSTFAELSTFDGECGGLLQ